MKFKAKLRRIGNSQGIYVPTEVIGNYKIGDEVEFDLISSAEVITKLKAVLEEAEKKIPLEEFKDVQVVPTKDWS